jgi:5'(3')-deoxyribonucleotidase
MNKPTIYLDFDETIVNTMQAFCSVYNEKYTNHKDFVLADYTKVYKYNFADQCPLLEDVQAIHDIFDSQNFFDALTLKDGCLEVLHKHKYDFNYQIVTIGTPKNLSHKVLWIEKNLPFIKDVILISNGNNKMDKSIINMFNSTIPNIFLDDHQDNLISSNANIKFCIATYGERDWSKDWEYRIQNWEQFDKILDVYVEEYLALEKYERNDGIGK